MNRRASLTNLQLAAFCAVVVVPAVGIGQQQPSVDRTPQNTVEIDTMYVSKGSAKFGEYNGLNRQGWYLSGNVDVQGGDAYASNKSGGTTRWEVTGNNLGLSNQSANVTVSNQGSWTIGAGYDELTQNVSNGNNKR